MTNIQKAVKKILDENGIDAVNAFAGSIKEFRETIEKHGITRFEMYSYTNVGGANVAAIEWTNADGDHRMDDIIC